MLILTRQPGQQIMIGDDIVIAILSIKGQQIRIGIDAPRDIAVHRDEIYDRIKQQEASSWHAPSNSTK